MCSNFDYKSLIFELIDLCTYSSYVQDNGGSALKPPGQICTPAVPGFLYPHAFSISGRAHWHLLTRRCSNFIYGVVAF